MTSPLSEPLTLPCGVSIPNRIAKAAMTEGLATVDGVPTPELARLYKEWSEGGAGLLLSGNILIDEMHLERPGNVWIDRAPDTKMQEALAQWAEAATVNGNQFWAQINHAGRQTQKTINANPKAPSAVSVGLPGGQFGQPTELTSGEIEDLIERYAIAAKAVIDAGFTGVQIHAAHGYLMSQFLSPLTNLRTDEYGGSLENRARPLLDAVKAVRSAIGAKVPISVKLNSADFQKGGFMFEDSVQVAQWLQDASVDLIEISGGNYEQPKLMGIEGLEPEEPQNVAQSTLMREAYFVDFALAMKETVKIPLMVTGGFRQRKAMEQALESGGADLIGLGRPMCVDVDAPNFLLNGGEVLARYESSMSLLPKVFSFAEQFKTVRAITGFALQYWYYAQLEEIGNTGKADPQMGVMTGARRVLKQQKEWQKARA